MARFKFSRSATRISATSCDEQARIFFIWSSFAQIIVGGGALLLLAFTCKDYYVIILVWAILYIGQAICTSQIVSMQRCRPYTFPLLLVNLLAGILLDVAVMTLIAAGLMATIPVLPADEVAVLCSDFNRNSVRACMECAASSFAWYWLWTVAFACLSLAQLMLTVICVTAWVTVRRMNTNERNLLPVPQTGHLRQTLELNTEPVQEQQRNARTSEYVDQEGLLISSPPSYMSVEDLRLATNQEDLRSIELQQCRIVSADQPPSYAEITGIR